MKIKVQSIHFDADKNLIRFVEEKVDKLKQFYEHIIEPKLKSAHPVKYFLQASNAPLLSRLPTNR